MAPGRFPVRANFERSGSDAFTILDPNNCFNLGHPTAIAAGSACDITVQFLAAGRGNFTATLNIITDANQSTVSLTGAGI